MGAPLKLGARGKFPPVPPPVVSYFKKVVLIIISLVIYVKKWPTVLGLYCCAWCPRHSLLILMYMFSCWWVAPIYMVYKKVHSSKMFTKLQVTQNLWTFYACMGSLGSAILFTTKIILKENFRVAHKNGRQFWIHVGCKLGCFINYQSTRQ